MKQHHTVERSIVKVLSNISSLDIKRPWTNSSFRDYPATGSGFCILINNNKFIMTNAHVIRHAISVQVRTPTSEIVYASVIYVSDEMDLALLFVEDSNWMDSLLPIKFNKVIPNKLDTIYIYGFPGNGGQTLNINISVTKGILNRIESNVIYNSGYRIIAFQVDGTVNPGNSGGPVVNKNGELVGVAYAKSSGSGQWIENASWIITPLNIQLFIDSFSDAMNELLQHGKKADSSKLIFPGICSLNVYGESTEHETLRRWLKLPDNKTGCLITFKPSTNIAMKHIKEYDVLMAIDGYDVDNIGNVSFSDILKSRGFSVGQWKGTGESVPLHFMINLKRPGEKINLDIWRNGKSVTESFAVETHKPIVPPFSRTYSTNYFIFMGMVFLPITIELLDEKYGGDNTLRGDIYWISSTITRKSPDQELVLLSETVDTQFTNGFPSDSAIVQSVCGEEIMHLQHLYETIKTHIDADEFIIIKYYGDMNITIIDPADFKKYDDVIRERYIGKVPAYSV